MKFYTLLCITFLLACDSKMNATCNPISYVIPPPVGTPESISFSPNGSYLATANADLNSVAIITVNSNGTLNKGTSYAIPVDAVSPVSVAFSPDGNYLATANANSDNVSVFYVETNGTLSAVLCILCLQAPCSHAR